MFSFAKLVVLPLALASLVMATPVARQNTKGTISLPVPGTKVAPGGSFDFKYNPRADYGESSYDYHVWLVKTDSVSKTFAPLDVFATGYYFGKFDYPNYPAVPYATNPAPPQLTIPDWSKGLGGFGAGGSGSNVEYSLVVIEEWGNGNPSLGRNIGTAVTTIIYNATST